MSYVLAFAGFAALIILHEFGHFAAAKAVGMRVERFSLFFPPLIARVRRGETEYAIGAVPLGGYVKITGMNPNERIPPEVEHRAYFRQPVWKRVVVIAAGPAMNFLIAFAIIWMLLLSLGQVRNDLSVNFVDASSPAAGQLRPDDKIVSIDGRPGYAPGLTAQEISARQARLRAVVAKHRCAGTTVDGCSATTAATVVVDRDGRRVTLHVKPRYDATARTMLLGIGYGRNIDIAPPRAAGIALSQMWSVTEATVSGIVKVFYNPEARKEVSGVVGSFEVTRQTVEFDTTRALYILALISLSLAVVNLFPFLPLDGGHIFWALAELARRKPVPLYVMERSGIVGFMLVILIFIIGLSNDIGRLSGDGFSVR